MVMKITTLNMPNQYLDYIQKLVDNGDYPSRSEVFRIAVEAFLHHEPIVMEDLKV